MAKKSGGFSAPAFGVHVFQQRKEIRVGAAQLFQIGRQLLAQLAVVERFPSGIGAESARVELVKIQRPVRAAAAHPFAVAPGVIPHGIHLGGVGRRRFRVESEGVRLKNRLPVRRHPHVFVDVILRNPGNRQAEKPGLGFLHGITAGVPPAETAGDVKVFRPRRPNAENGLLSVRMASEKFIGIGGSAGFPLSERKRHGCN